MENVIAVNIRDANGFDVDVEFVEDTEESLEELREYWMEDVMSEVRDDGELYWTMNWTIGDLSLIHI